MKQQQRGLGNFGDENVQKDIFTLCPEPPPLPVSKAIEMVFQKYICVRNCPFSEDQIQGDGQNGLTSNATYANSEQVSLIPALIHVRLRTKPNAFASQIV